MSAARGQCKRHVYYENVGGAVLHAVIPLLNPFARVPVCGLAAWYNLTGAPEGPDMSPALMGTILRMKVRLQGFIVYDSFGEDEHRAFLSDMKGWLDDGSITYREQMVEGLENAPDALNDVLTGASFGKVVVRVA